MLSMSSWGKRASIVTSGRRGGGRAGKMEDVDEEELWMDREKVKISAWKEMETGTLHTGRKETCKIHK